MRIITIAGTHSGVGKTALAVLLLGRLKGYAAIKVSKSDFMVSVTDRKEVIEERGKDTALMKEAGASPVVWVQTNDREQAECLSLAMGIVSDAQGVMIEGNSAARAVKADKLFFVTGTDLSGMKPGALNLLEKADVIVVNQDSEVPPAGLLEELRAHNPKALMTTMGAAGHPEGELAELLSSLSVPGSPD